MWTENDNKDLSASSKMIDVADSLLREKSSSPLRKILVSKNRW